MTTWCSLHTHSQYSILDALPSVDDLAKKAADLGMPALALTDHGNMYGAVEFFQACKKSGVKPIIGCEVYVAPRSRHEKKKMPGERAAYHLVLLAKNEVGYRNLCRLSSKGFLEGFYYFPRIDWELLEEHREGLICLSACMSSEVAHAALEGDYGQLVEQINKHKQLFGEDFYIELQRHTMGQEQIEADGFLQETWLYQQYESFIARQDRLNQLLVKAARELNVPLVATNDIHYIEQADWRAHEVLLNVQSGEPCEIWERDSLGNPKTRVPNPKRRTYASHELYFKSPDQMTELFADLPDALTNTGEIAKKCEFEFDFSARHYPVFIPPELEGQAYVEEERQKASEHYLQKLCEEAIPSRYSPERLAKVQEQYPDQDPIQVVRDRLQFEMNVIVPKGMCDYLLIVWDFIHWAKSQGIPVGPGRGSGAGSIILFLIGVTDIEPLRFNLFFERFINPERLSYPDIDVDICMERRGEVIDYTVNKYGKECVAQIITFGTMKAKMAIKDVGRVLSVALPKVNHIAKLIPEDIGMTLDKALDVDADLYRLYSEDEEVKRVIDLAKKLEGSIRSTGIHAAGVIVAGQPLTEHIPVCVAKDSEMAVTQYSMKPVEKVGMLKIDFLGLKTLTCIQKAVGAIRRKGIKIDEANLPLDDTNTFALFNSGKTNGVFQMESGGMQDLSRQLHLDRFEEIIAVVSLYRPGPMEMIPSFIDRKHGREPIEYDHALMKEILAETYGIMVYQEQVMAIAQTLANYSLGEGDVLRRAMGKKIMEEMAKQREKFRSGALANGIDEKTATEIFDKMEQFAKYGFNKSHAACYGMLAYITAYLKANYPGEWMAALMTCDRDDTTKVAHFIRECQSMGIAILPPDVNEAGETFNATSGGIRFALSGIKGVGHGVVEAIIEEREKNGPYQGLFDFLRRVDGKKVGKKVTEVLCEAGCFDFTGWTRDQLQLSVAPMYDAAAQKQKEEKAGVITLFSLMPQEESSRFNEPPTVEKSSSKTDQLLRERELLGFFLTGHPLAQFKNELQQLSVIPLTKLEQLDHQAVVRIAAVIETVAIKIASKNQKKFAILTISDGFESYELPIWSDIYDEHAAILVENQLIYAVVVLDKQGETLRLSCKWLADLTQADEGTIVACDHAYDKAKQQIAFRSRNKERKMEKKQEENRPIAVQVDMEKVHLTHILKVKEIFRSHKGTCPVNLNFILEAKTVGKVEINSEWGVGAGKALNADLQNIPSIISVES